MDLSWLGFATCPHGSGYRPTEQPEAGCHKCREAKLAAEIKRLRARIANRDATIRRLGDWEAYEADIEMMVDALPVERAGRSWHNAVEAVENTVASYEAEIRRLTDELDGIRLDLDVKEAQVQVIRRVLMMPADDQDE